MGAHSPAPHVVIVFRDYDIPAGRTADSMRFKVEEWRLDPEDRQVTDTLYTDDAARAGVIADAIVEQGYSMTLYEHGTVVRTVHNPEA